MREAHAPIVSLASGALSSRRALILDLGCGNGALLHALAARSPHTSVIGIEREGTKVERARQVLAGVPHALFTGDMFDEAGPWRNVRPDLVLLMPGRLLEVTADRAARLRQWLLARHCLILAYAYDDWIPERASISQLCERAGLEATAPAGARAALAAVRADQCHPAAGGGLSRPSAGPVRVVSDRAARATG
jgi:SAM-dependent methyltransferase